MSNIPIIVGFGGINSGGRGSGCHAYKRILHDVLHQDTMRSTWQDLACRMKLKSQLVTPELVEHICQNTLLRKINSFDPDKIESYFDISSYLSNTLVIELEHEKLPSTIPHSWLCENIDGGRCRITIKNPKELMLPIHSKSDVTCGGNLPTGFKPGELYASKQHPRSLELAIYGCSDAINSLGLDWDCIMAEINPDEIGVYASCALGQADPNSLTGLAVNTLLGKPYTPKMIALSFGSMPADFINSYVINSLGKTGSHSGTCASFLYNLKQGVEDIKSGKSKVVIVGTSEAPLQPEIVKGFSKIGAVAKDESLQKNPLTGELNYQCACRPFSNGTGFALAESSQYIILMDDVLALNLGANILGSVPDVFVHADANKGSITTPGVGNYITLTKTLTLAKKLLGEKGLQKTYVHAHGTGTVLNRKSESLALNSVASGFGISDWPVTAIKSYFGHSIASASGDQINIALGVWQHGWIPGISSIKHISEDVTHDNLNILMKHKYVGLQGKDMQAAIINARGFGGNNATTLIISPHKTIEILKEKHGKAMLIQHHDRNVNVLKKTNQHNMKACKGIEKIRYFQNVCVLDDSDIMIKKDKLYIQKKHLPT